MAKDIEDFLRRAAERRREQQKPAPAPPPPPPPQPRRPTLAESRPTPVEPIIIDDIEVVEEVSYANRPGLRQQSVQEHVKQYLDTSDIASHAEQLGDRISDVSRQVDQRVHQHLDHDISKIDDRPTITDDPTPAIVGAQSNALTGELRKMLSNPQAAGKAIFLAEILKRPEWD